eukprot:GHVT01088859.1.p1 GENE.GHVT01088859.1~~GHVT01088859.1.p1  ORF type:complete len:597 (-),score=158.35 GHVT01088859.1:570-2162(-)
MAGKSTFCRSLLATVLLANVGLFAPCGGSSSIPRYDAFVSACAVAFDAPAAGRSLYAQEVEQLRVLLAAISSNSFVVVDEPCKGTSPKCGAALVGSFLEHLDSIGVSGVVSTHLHSELLRLPLATPRVSARRMGFLVCPSSGALRPSYQLERGTCTESLGLLTARAVGLHPAILRRAEELERIIEAAQRGPDHHWHRRHAELNAPPATSRREMLERKPINGNDERNPQLRPGEIRTNLTNALPIKEHCQIDRPVEEGENELKNQLYTTDTHHTLTKPSSGRPSTNTNSLSKSSSNTSISSASLLSAAASDISSSLAAICGGGLGPSPPLPANLIQGPAPTTDSSTNTLPNTTTTSAITSSSSNSNNSSNSSSIISNSSVVSSSISSNSSSVVSSNVVSLGPSFSPPAGLYGRACVYVLFAPSSFSDSAWPCDGAGVGAGLESSSSSPVAHWRAGVRVYVGESEAIAQRLRTHRRKSMWREAVALVHAVADKSKARQAENVLINRLVKQGYHVLSLHDGTANRTLSSTAAS